MNRRTLLKALAALPIIGVPFRPRLMPGRVCRDFTVLAPPVKLSGVVGDGSWHYVEEKYDDGGVKTACTIDGRPGVNDLHTIPVLITDGWVGDVQGSVLFGYMVKTK